MPVEPNLHAALVHFPVALITLGVIVEIFSFLWWRSGARAAGRWMIVFGVLSAIPTITTGLYALRQTVGAGMGEAMWEEIVSSSTWSSSHWEALQEHVQYTAAGALLMLVGIVVWIASSDAARQRLYLLGVVVLIAGAGMVGYGASQGGDLVYRYGTGVRMIQPPPADGETQAAGHSEDGAVNEMMGVRFSPMEAHVLLAGISIALLAAALGLSVRRSNVALENQAAEEKAIAAGYRPAGRSTESGNVLAIPLIYPGHFWLLSVLFVIATVVAGLWMFGAMRPGAILEKLQAKKLEDEWRSVIHVYLAVAILIMAIALGILMRFWPRRRFVMGVLCTLLVLALSLQAWTGILMLFDGDRGPLLRFNQMQANQPMSISVPVEIPSLQPAQALEDVPAADHVLETPVKAPEPVPSLEAVEAPPATGPVGGE